MRSGGNLPLNGGQRPWLAAAASIVVTPPAGRPMAGYVDRPAASTGTADDLEVNVLVIDRDGELPVAWVSIDSLAITPVLRATLVDAIRMVMDIRPDRIRCTASHSHSAPTDWIGSVHPVLPGRVDREELDRLGQAVAGATVTWRPVTLECATTSVEDVGSNRHHIDGPHDRSVGVLTVRELDSSVPLAVMYDFACHPTILGPDNTKWSADWVAGARNAIRAALGAALPVIFQQGCAGDVSPRFHRRARTHAEAIRLGELVGRQVAESARAPGEPIVPGAISVRRRIVVLPRRPAMTLEPRTGHAISEVGPPSDDRVAASLVEGLRSRRALSDADLPAELEVPISTVQIGSRRWLHIPVELFASFGLALRERHPEVRVAGYSDGYVGYIADAEAYAIGHYEALSSFFDLPTSLRLVDEFGALIAELPSR